MTPGQNYLGGCRTEKKISSEKNDEKFQTFKKEVVRAFLYERW